MFLRLMTITCISFFLLTTTSLMAQSEEKLLKNIDRSLIRLDSLRDNVEKLKLIKPLRKELEGFYRTYVASFKNQKDKMRVLFEFINKELGELSEYYSIITELDAHRRELVTLRQEVITNNADENAWERYKSIKKKLNLYKTARKLKFRVATGETRILEAISVYLEATKQNSLTALSTPSVSMTKDLNGIENPLHYLREAKRQTALAADDLFDLTYKMHATLSGMDIIKSDEKGVKDSLFSPYQDMNVRVEIAPDSLFEVLKKQVSFLRSRTETDLAEKIDEIKKAREEKWFIENETSIAKIDKYLIKDRLNLQIDKTKKELIALARLVDDKTDNLRLANQGLGNHKSVLRNLALQLQLLEDSLANVQRQGMKAQYMFDSLKLTTHERLDINEILKIENEILQANNVRLSTANFNLEATNKIWLALTILSVLLCITAIGVHYFDLRGNHKKLQKSNILLKNTFHELHHRTGNNLRMVSALLGLQANNLVFPDAKIALRSAQDRLSAIGMVHRRLYQKMDLENINIAEYIQDLISELKKSFEYQQQPLTVDSEVEHIEMDGDTAIHLGILINEVITNAFKHAFRDNPAPKLTIRMQGCEEDKVQLLIQDNGQGIPKTINPTSPKSFGMKVIRLMVEDQLDGHFQLIAQQGTRFQATLKYK